MSGAATKPPLKRCTKCNIEKPLSRENWNRNKESIDGFCARCKTCMKAYRRQYESSEKGKETIRRKKARYRKANQLLEMPASTVKTCNRCSKTKPASEFVKNVSNRDGLHAYCKPCAVAQQSDYRKRNPDKAKARNKQWRKQNPAYHHRKMKEYRDAGKCPVKAWRRKYPDRHKASCVRKRTLRKGAEGSFKASDVKSLVRRQGDRCFYCTTSLSNGLHLDHLIPISRGGTNFVGNMVASCPLCNMQKGNKTPIEFKVWRLALAVHSKS